MTIYGILDASARLWWYHRQLRESGRVAEARQCERASIRDHARDLRKAQLNGGFVTIGRGGWTLHMERRHTLKGYGDLSDPIPQCARLLGLPIVDSTTIPDERLDCTLALPFAQVGALPRVEYGSFDPAPIEVVAWMYRDLGATVFNVKRHIPGETGGQHRGQWQVYDACERRFLAGCGSATRAECQEVCAS